MRTRTLYSLACFTAIASLTYSCNTSGKGEKREMRQTVIFDQKREVTLDSNSGKLFDILTGKSTGIHFVNDLRETYQVNDFRYVYMYQGGGVCIGDINGDGLQDIYLTGNVSPSKLYLNKDNLQFEDITEKSGLNKLPTEWTMSAAMVDYDGDGDLDIYECVGRWEDSAKSTGCVAKYMSRSPSLS